MSHGKQNPTPTSPLVPGVETSMHAPQADTRGSRGALLARSVLRAGRHARAGLPGWLLGGLLVIGPVLMGFETSEATAAPLEVSTQAGQTLQLAQAVSAPEATPESTAGRNDFAHQLDETRFLEFATTAPNIHSIKLVVDRKPETGEAGPVVYFLNSQIYDLHINFIRQNKLVPKEQIRTIQLDSWRNEDRRFIMAQLARYDQPGGASQVVIELFDEDKASAKLIAELHGAISKAISFGPLQFKPNSLEQEARRSELKALNVPMLDNEALNANRLYQVVNAGQPAVGRLRLVTETDPSVVETMTFNRNEIVLLQTIPNDITRVAGIITTRPTTPLSHVSLRARTWNIPNVMLREALGVVYKNGLEDQWVLLEVTPEGLPHLRRATTEEVQKAEVKRQEAAPKFLIPRADLSTTTLQDLFSLREGDVVRYGAKAANLGELASLTRELPAEDLEPVLKATEGRWFTDTFGKQPLLKPHSNKRRAEVYLGRLHVPPGFGIPFSAWQAFLEYDANREISTLISSALIDPQFQQDPEYRRQKLDAIQEAIRSGTIPPEWSKRILDRIHQDLPDRRLFVRSSTNSEDLEGFNGAGLYETVGNVEGDDAILLAIKRVWSSIWSFKAYEARSDYGIDHRTVFPGVLVQEAVKPYAAGVLISKDVLNARGGYRFYINANPGFGENTVNSGRGAPEQLYGNPATGEVQRISLSERGGDLLTDTEVRQLVFFSAIIERHFGRLASRFPYPQDIEWLVVDGRVSIVQARPFLEAQTAQTEPAAAPSPTKNR